MEKDVHFYATGVLAKAAGFTEQEAFNIAYASNYVDDATEGDSIKVGDILFDPVRTAHLGLKAFDWDVQKSIYIPFHFLPPDRDDRSKKRFITKRNSEFAHKLFQMASDEPDGLFRLIRMGIALHTLADTWSHEGFSGRFFENENDVEAINIWKNSAWSHPTLENIYLDFCPRIGHAQAGYYPDIPYLRWKCQLGPNLEENERANQINFMEACKAMYDLLIGASLAVGRASSRRFDDIKDGILTCLAYPEELEQRCQKWRQTFNNLMPSTMFTYDKLAWRREALHDGDVNWDPSSRSQFARLFFKEAPNFWDSPWVLFHKAALKQRHIVLEHLQ